MPLVYPTSRDDDTTDVVPDDPELAYQEFASDWSDLWLLELHTDPEHDHGDDDEEEGDEAIRIGPLGARAAWDLGNELEERRPGWVIVILPLFEPEDADSIVAQIEAG